MMLQKSKQTVTRYEFDEWYVDIVNLKNGQYEAWLTRKGYGMSSLMFGGILDANDKPISRKEFMECVEASLWDDIEIYWAEIEQLERED